MQFISSGMATPPRDDKGPAAEPVETTLIVEGKPSLTWSAAIYKKSRSGAQGADPRMFEHLNRYLATLTPEHVNTLYSLYAEAREVQSSGLDHEAMTAALQNIATGIYNVITLESVLQWVRESSGLRVPDTVKPVLSSEIRTDDLTIARTYLVEDYIQLVALALAARLMIPIWGEYMVGAKTVSGNQNKERQALKLLYHTSLIRTPAMARLIQYIEAWSSDSSKGGPSGASVMGGAGTTATPEILLSIVLVRRLALCDLISTDGTTNVITNLYQFVQFNLRGMDRKFGGLHGAKIGDKEQTNSMRDDNNDSRLELLRTKESVPAAVAVKKNSYSEKLETLVRYVDPTIPMEMVRECETLIQLQANRRYTRQQTFLMQMVMGSAIVGDHPNFSPQAMPLMSQNAHNNVAAVVQAALWHWNFPQLATYLTAEEVQTDVELLGVSESQRWRVPVLEVVRSLYPYERQLPRSRSGSKYSNVGQRQADAFSVAARRPIWRLLAPPGLIQLMPQPYNVNAHEYLASIRDELIDLAARVNQ